MDGENTCNVWKDVCAAICLPAEREQFLHRKTPRCGNCSPSSTSAALIGNSNGRCGTCRKASHCGDKGRGCAGIAPDPIAAGLEALSKQQMKLRKERKDLARQVKNAKKKVQRLKLRARQLTDDDLVAVLMMRKAAASAKAEPGAGLETASSSSSASSSTAQHAIPTAEPGTNLMAQAHDDTTM